MTTFLLAAVMVLVGGFGVGVVLTREPLRQVIALAPFACSIVLFFVLLQAPDVVLSAIVATVLAYPVMVVLTIAGVRGRERRG